MKAQTYRKPQQTFGEKMSGKLKYVKKKLAVIFDLLITGTAAHNYF